MYFDDEKRLVDYIGQLVIHQIKNYWFDFDEEIIKSKVKVALKKVEICFCASQSKYLHDGEKMIFSPQHSVTWMIFLYYLSHELAMNQVSGRKEADCVYYLNKIMHDVDWYHAIELPPHFMAEHPLGSVLGRAKYGDYFMVYQGTTVGGNGFKEDGSICYPEIGKNCVMYANSTILGKSILGDNVIVAAETYMKDAIIPDNCMVFGHSPNLVIKQCGEAEIRKRTSHIWKWEM
jgi:serine O-acetyltransferase